MSTASRSKVMFTTIESARRRLGGFATVALLRIRLFPPIKKAPHQRLGRADRRAACGRVGSLSGSATTPVHFLNWSLGEDVLHLAAGRSPENRKVLIV